MKTLLSLDGLMSTVLFGCQKYGCSYRHILLPVLPCQYSSQVRQPASVSGGEWFAQWQRPEHARHETERQSRRPLEPPRCYVLLWLEAWGESWNANDANKMTAAAM